MAISNFISAVTSELSSTAKILTDSSSEEFKAALERWTDLELKTPAAIVVAATDKDILKTVCLHFLGL